MKSKRKKIPPNIRAEVVFQSDGLCCVDEKPGDHIHHINGDTSNFSFDNLALLCYSCHDRASRTGSLSFKLSAQMIIKYREHHYKVIQTKRANALKSFDNPISKLSSEALLTASKNAIIILEIERIKEEYFKARTNPEREEILGKLHKYSNHSNARVARELLWFLFELSHYTRMEEGNSITSAIYTLIMSFYPVHDIKSGSKQAIELGNLCCNIAFNIIYDSAIHLRKLRPAEWGLLILKLVYRHAQSENLSKLKEKVSEVYSSLDMHLNRPERNDLGPAKELINVFKEDSTSGVLVFPDLPEHLYRLIEKERKMTV